tara:strand:- start:214 stop:441 length:228 start_codon:yes stop_codon:yes gene_type:complete
MSLDYEKRLLELRKLDYMEDYKDKPKEEEQSFMRRRVVQEEDKEEKNPLQSFQEVSFLRIMFQSRDKMGDTDVSI